MKKAYLSLITLLILTASVIAQDKPQYRIATYRAGVFLGNIDIELFPLIAPNHVHNFDSLALALAFDSTAFHRVVPGFVIQGGDPNSINGPISTWGSGNPNQPTVNAEFSVARHLRGRIGAARDTDINSASSQFYICVANALFLDGQYTVYGQAIAGMDIVDTIVSSPRDVNDVPLQKIEMFVTSLGVNPAIPFAPTLTTPLDQAVGVQATQTFQWSAVTDGVIYTAEFSTDSTFATINATVNAGTNQVAAPPLLSSTKYYWRVKTNNGGHESVYSNIFSFTTTITVPALLYPTNTATGIVTNPVFNWTNVGNNVTYTLQVATNISFAGASIIYNQAGITGTTQQVAGLNPNSLYYWRVRASDTLVNGNFSPRYNFTTGTSVSLAENKLESHIVKIYPNPTSNILNVDLSFKENASVMLSIVDLLGKEIETTEVLVSSQTKSIALNVSTVSAGNYILKVKKGNEIASYKIQISK